MLRVLAHLQSPELALAKAWRVLRSGGTLVIAAHGPGHLAGLLTTEEQGVRPPVPEAVPGFDRPSPRGQLDVSRFKVSRPLLLETADQRSQFPGIAVKATPCPERQTNTLRWSSEEPACCFALLILHILVPGAV